MQEQQVSVREHPAEPGPQHIMVNPPISAAESQWQHSQVV